jgi:cytochrome c-type biogenesis protein
VQLSGNFAYSFMLGVLAAVNPCGFAMLPNYLIYFLGIDDPNESPTSSIRRSVRIGLSVSSGFLAVFIVVGVVSRVFTQWIEQNAKYFALVIGLGLVVVGIRMLFGWKPKFAVPQSSRQLDRTTQSMFVYGVIYAVASIGCTIGFLTTAIFGSFATHGVASGVISVVLYGLGMSLFVTVLTVLLGLARQGLSCRRSSWSSPASTSVGIGSSPSVNAPHSDHSLHESKTHSPDSPPCCRTSEVGASQQSCLQCSPSH